MTEKQKEWVDKKIEVIKNGYESLWPLSEEQWTQYTDDCRKLFELSKKNPEVLKEIYKLHDYFRDKELEEKKNEK